MNGGNSDVKSIGLCPGWNAAILRMVEAHPDIKGRLPREIESQAD
jgi:hypothetical protein